MNCETPYCVSDHDNPLEVGHRITSEEGIRHHCPDRPGMGNVPGLRVFEGSVTEVTLIDGPLRPITAQEEAELMAWMESNPL